MSSSRMRRPSLGPNSRRSSTAASVSTVSSSDSDNQSHVTVDSDTFKAVYDRAFASAGQPTSGPLLDSETAKFSVDGAGNVRVKRTRYLADLRRLSDSTLRRITGAGYGRSGVMRVRYHRQPSKIDELQCFEIDELQCFEDGRGSLLKTSIKSRETGRTSLADNLGLRPNTGDKYSHRSILSDNGPGSGIPVDARSDEALEENVYDISSKVFHAKPGAMRMPLKKNADFSGRTAARRPPAMKFYSFETPPGRMCHQVTSDKDATPKSPSPANARAPSAFVQQKVRRADNKHSSRDKGPKSGDSVQYETLWTIPRDAE